MLHIKHTCTSLSLPCLTTMTHCCFLCIMNTLVECKLALSVFKFSEWLDVTAVGKTQLALASWFPSSRDDVWVLSQFSEELLFYCWLCTAVVFTESTWCLCITVLYCIAVLLILSSASLSHVFANSAKANYVYCVCCLLLMQVQTSLLGKYYLINEFFF